MKENFLQKLTFINYLLKLSFVTRSSISKTSSIGKFSRIDECTFHSYSYCASSCLIFKSNIGRYSSIGPRVKVVAGLHPFRKLSLSSIFHGCYWSKRTKLDSLQIFSNPNLDHSKIGAFGAITNFEEDVWIGADARILSGVKIARGSVVGASSLVLEDTEPYSINVGIPSKKINTRFSKDKIAWLEESKWWEYSPKKVSEIFLNSPYYEY